MPTATTLFLAVAISSIGALCAHIPSTGQMGYRPLGNISIPHPSFVRVLPCGSATKSNSLWVTQFSALKAGQVTVIDNITQYYPNFSAAKFTTVASDFKWPNFISVAPEEIGDFVVVPDGFLVPFKDSGGVYLIPATCTREGGSAKNAGQQIQLTQKESYFYHKVEWRDMNGDGKLDILTAHAKKPLFGSAQGQLLWLEQPAADPLKAVPWKEHVLMDGPDIWFASLDLNTSDSHFEVFVTEFFAEELSVILISNKNAQVLTSRVIDPSIGPAFAVSVVDLNADGRQELLVSNHVDKAGGGVYAYEIPDDVIKGDFKKHTLAENFTVTERGLNQAAPGFPYAVFPHANYTGKPYILVAGDGSQKAYLMYPTSTDFQYKLSVIISLDGVVGSIGYGDVIGNDGWTEFFVPDYDNGQIYAYTFAP